MKRTLQIIGLLTLLCVPAVNLRAAFDPIAELARYNVIWDSPSADARGSMPIGNGDIGLNVWVEPSGDFVFLVGKTDAWDENMRLLKLGKVRVRLTPPLVQPDGKFSQTLDLARGRCIIRTAGAEVCVWVDANHPVIQVDAKSLDGRPLAASASFEMWRKEKRVLPVSEQGYPAARQPAYSWPDVVLPAKRNQIGWYHRNAESAWMDNLKLQKLEAIAAQEADPILNRTTGAILRGDNWVSVSDTELKTEKPAEALSLRIHPLTQVSESAESWVAAVEKQADTIEKSDARRRGEAHDQWWSAFWNRSWIYVSGDAKAESVTRAYTLQRWMNACSGRGAYPIKFNGSIFVVENFDKRNWDADFRAWGGAYWFQNTRLCYWPMLAAGDFDLMRPFFDLYAKALPIRQRATKTYYGHDGAFFPETMTIWGTYQDKNYGTNRAGRPDGETENTFIRRYWQGGIENITMMLDYHDLTQDDAFRDQTLIPFASAVTTFFDQHWQRGADGKIRFDPAQSLETWHDAVNPMPEVAGLRYVLPRLLEKTSDPTRKAAWQKTLDDLPLVPMQTDSATGKSRLLPAAECSRRSNIENPELYAVFPYRLYGVGHPDLEVGLETWRRRLFKATGCWRQDAIQAALLGLGDEAAAMVASNSAGSSKSYRFPAMWGAGFDWAPDQDHGGVTMIALQAMLLQANGEKILTMPAWPKGWDVEFKLHAPRLTTVEGSYRSGKLSQLKVTPEGRSEDVIMPEVR